MKNRLKILLILPMFLVSCFLGFNVPRNVSAANISQNGDFEAFSNQVVNMIRKYDDNNYEEIVFTINDDLYEQNNTLMVSVDTFADFTGAVVERVGNSLTITSSTKSIELQEDEEIVTVSDNSVIYMQQPLTRINEDFSISFEDISTILGYEIFEKEDEIVLSRPFESKRIILKSSKPIDDKGAIASASGYNDFYIYQYSSEQNAINAYDYFKTLDCVEWVEPDAIYTTCDIEEGKALPQGLQDDYSYSSWGADAMGIESYSNYLIDTVGKNNLNEVIVAVIDTGIDTDHEWFEDRILLDLGKNYSSSVSSSAYDFEDVYGHGTHCAGIVCDLTLDNVKILPIKVMNDQGYGYASQIMLGINYVTSLKTSYNIVAMNLSLGSANGIGSEEYNSYSTALNNAYANGIMPVVAAGNDGADVTNHTPANIECAITVAAIGESAGLYYRTSWSNYGSFVDVCAPGHYILSACVGGGTVLMSGTSMAAPHIAGAIGLLMSDSNKTYTLRDIENLLDVNVIDLGDDGWDSFYGEGLVNLEYAYAELMNNVTFSHTQTDCTETFNLTLTSSQAGAKIYYTTDGSTPTLDNGTLYSSPILVNKTQRIKARAYVVSSGVVTKYTKVSQMTYCFYGQDVEGAFVVSADGVLTSYAGVLTEVTVPKEVDGITITSIGQNAFTSSSVISVTLPSSVTTIGAYAFNGCSTVQTVYGPNVKVIDMYAFNGCKNMRYVTDEYFPELTTIGKYAFYQCYNLRPISLSKVTKVDYWAFGMKNVTPTYLTSVSLPSATIIAEGAFIFCQYLTNINIPSAEIIASGAFRECDIINLSLPSVKYIGNHSFYVNENLLSANMPEVEIIGSSAFYYYCKKLSNVYIPNVKIICDTAFRECVLITSLDMPNVERIGDWAFYDCDKLATINIPNLKYIGYVAFGSCDKLTVVNLPNAISIGQGAFRMISGLTKVTLSSCLEVIGNNSFSSASKTACVFEIYAGTAGEDFVINNGYNYIDLSTNNSIFSYYVVSKEVYITGLDETPTENIIIPSYINDMPVVKICNDAFKNCEHITSLNVAYLREIGNNAFEGCVNLEKVNLSRIETVGNNAFLNCTSLNEVNIQNVKNVGDRAFYGCSSLLEVRFGQNISFVGTKAFGYSYEEMLIPTFVIYGYADTYAEIYAENENIVFRAIFNELTHYYYNTYVNPENGQTEILISFVDSFTTGNLILPSSYNGRTISKIGDQAFYNCSFITGIILPETITTIGVQSFYGCTLLESINLELSDMIINWRKLIQET